MTDAVHTRRPVPNAGAQAGRVVLVTGGGTGIGAAIAARYAAEGAQVVIVGRRRGPLEAVAAEIGAVALCADTANGGEASAAIAATLARFGRLDVVVANAGGHGLGTVGETSDDAWHQSMRANLDTAFVTTRAALDALIASGGQIVIVSSLAGLFAGPEVAGYTVAKHALIGLTKSLARDYGPRGIRVNAVCPGWVRTPMADAEMDDFAAAAGGDREAGYRRVTGALPIARPADPEEIASAVRFLGSDESSYITGATLVIDGGAHIVDVPTIAMAG
ncbi:MULTISPECIES: SDR family NAD(P)-dependent oxidoreductase [unclassified Leucobacter]|uniref:SDR family NAD(P)-dependent oxidoreductase n=1 Tax=unclassified Leucobacter TaxID=2621730 RepID=UPI00165DF30A|nr:MULTISPECIES: SDR family oxidoreductase [unclassified Leucobacter]MBC9937202.1 SDR family oxidoreductase [Leucobacter sp. cx-87]